MDERKLGVGLGYLNNALEVITGFAYVPLLIHYIGVAEYGLYTLVGSIMACFSVMDFGMSSSVVQYYTAYRSQNDQEKLENVLCMSLAGHIGAALMVLLLGVLCYYYIPEEWLENLTSEELAMGAAMFKLLLFNMMLTISTMVFSSILNAHSKYLLLNGLNSLSSVVQLVLVVLILQAAPSALSVAVVQTVLNVAATILRIYYCFSRLHIRIRYHYFDKEMCTGFIHISILVFFILLVHKIFFKTNELILGAIDGTEAVAVYSLANLIYMNLANIVGAISSVYECDVMKLIALNAPMHKVNKLFVIIGRSQCLVLSLLVSTFFIFGYEFIDFWAGAEFLSAYHIALVILIPYSIELLQTMGDFILRAQKDYKFKTKIYVLSGIVSLALAVWLGSIYGALGCAVATSASMLLCVLLVSQHMKNRGVDIDLFWREMWHIIRPGLIFTVAFYIFGTLGQLYHPGISAGECILWILSYMLAYGVIEYHYSMNRNERRYFKALLNGIGMKW